ncbi:hypothetical protein CLAIMM_08918 isoform 3 [Cladophialophora immunda]|nr:hypothetical protein CLAIMM_08918 isoform 3 [Cladophialophora immunda]
MLRHGGNPWINFFGSPGCSHCECHSLYVTVRHARIKISTLAATVDHICCGPSTAPRMLSQAQEHTQQRNPVKNLVGPIESSAGKAPQSVFRVPVAEPGLIWDDVAGLPINICI